MEQSPTYGNIVNGTSSEEPDLWSIAEGDHIYRHSRTFNLILILGYMIILIVGVGGNLFVVGVMIIFRRMRTVTNLFILNLAVADLFVILFCLFPTIFSNIFVHWVLGGWMCKTLSYVQVVSVSASVYSLVAISLDRCFAIWFPLGVGFTRRKARLIICLIWLISCTVAIPWALYFELITPDPMNRPHLRFCYEKWPKKITGDLYFLIGNFLFCYIIPLFVITICYILIWVKVVNRNVPTDSFAILQKFHQQAKIGVLKLLVGVVLFFLLSWLPLYIIFARIKLGGKLSPWEDNLLAIATPLAQWLGLSNSALNPIIYAVFNVKFRRAFQSWLPNDCTVNQYPPSPCPPRLTRISIMRNGTSMINLTTAV